MPRNLSGRWIGRYLYGPVAGAPDPVPFSMLVTERFPARLTGSVLDDPSLGVPEVASLSGYRLFRRLYFSKQHSHFWVTSKNGPILLRDFCRLEYDDEPITDHAHPVITYHGTLASDGSSIDGRFHLRAHVVPLRRTGQWLPFTGYSGTWHARRDHDGPSSPSVRPA